ncbi:hypothetical protein KW795_02570 [Candidatus Microgenomates bacterium]|nr:hypothetical protein [Candidatus Microgenomates bacterium]
MSADRLPRVDIPEYVLNCILGTFDPNVVFSPTRNQVKDIAASVIGIARQELTMESHEKQQAIFLKEINCEGIYKAILFGCIVAEGLQDGTFLNPMFKDTTYRYTLRNVMSNIHSQLRSFYEIPDPRRKLGYKVSLEIPVLIDNVAWQLEGSYFVRHSGVVPITSISAIPVTISK